MSDGERDTAVAHAHPALLEMLDSLLAEVPAVQPEPPPAPVEAPPAPAPVLETHQPVAPALNKPQARPLQQPRECIVYGTDTRTLNLPESRFSAIEFGVGRYRFVAPLNMLDSVQQVAQRPTPMFGQPDWHRGVVLNRGRQMVLVDIGALLGLEDAEPVTEPDHVLVLPGGRYGLLSSKVPEPLTLTGSGIRWSRPEQKRTWLAGLLPEQMCVLLDTEALLALVQPEKKTN